MMMNTQNPFKSHYHLIAGNVVYQENSAVGEPVNPMGVMTLNTIVQAETGNFAVRHIAQAQQGLQHRFYKETGDNNLRVVDVVILNVSYLGEMTVEDFHKAPEGTKEEKVTMQ